jgi:hypothetical protein
MMPTILDPDITPLHSLPVGERRRSVHSGAVPMPPRPSMRTISDQFPPGNAPHKTPPVHFTPQTLEASFSTWQTNPHRPH